MTDIANLGIAVDSSGVTNASGALDKLSTSARAAETATQALSGAAQANAAAEAAAASAAERAANSNRRLAGTAEDSARSIRNSRNAMVQAGIQLQDFAIQVASGGNPLMAFVQQASQLQQVSSVTGVTLRQIAGNFLAMLTPVRVVTGVLIASGIAVATASYQYSESQLRIERALAGIGRGSGATATQINEIAQRIAGAGQVSVSTARDIQAAFAATGRIDVTFFERLGRITRDFAATIGEDVPNASRLLARAFADPARGADQLNERLGFLDDRTRQYIRTLANSGREEQARQVLFNALIPQLTTAGNLTNVFGRAWEFVARNASNAADAIGRALSGPQTAADRYTEATRRLAEARAGEEGRNRRPRTAFQQALEDPNAAAERQRRLRELEAEAEHLNEVARREQQIRAMEQRRVEDARRSTQAGEIVRSTNDPRVQELRRITEEMERLRQVADDPILVERAGGIQAVQEAYNRLLRLRRNMTDENGNLVTSEERVRQAHEENIREIEQNYSPTQQRLNAIARERRRLLEQNVEPQEAELRATQEGELAYRRATEALRENSAERQLAADQQVRTIRAEQEMVGRSVGEQARMRAELQARNMLEQEARRNRLTPAEQEAELRFHQQRAEAIGRETQELERRRIVLEATQERRLLMMSDEEGKIARNLIPIYGQDFARALRSPEAAMMRFTNHLEMMRNAGGDFFSTLARDIAEGAKPIDALTNALRRMATQLLELSTRQLWQQAFGGLFGNTGGGGGGNLIGSIFSGIRSFFGFASASGNAFGDGGLLNIPTIHRTRDGKIGIAGEAGTEAVLPLTRDSSGKLGVHAEMGASASNIYSPNVVFSPVMNINMPEGATEEEGRQFGEGAMRELRGVFRQFLVSEMREGGVLRQI